MAKEKHPGGRPPSYKKIYCVQAEKLCRLGATDKDLADFFNVCEATINNWKDKYPQFLESVNEGKKYPNEEIVKSLFQSAKGYSHKEDKIFYDSKLGKTVVEPTIKHYPPNFNSIQLWLLNRMPEDWRNKQDINLSGKLDLTVEPITLNDLESQILKEKPREEE